MTQTKAKEGFASWAFTTALDLRRAVGIGVILAAAISIKRLDPQDWSAHAGADFKNFLIDKAPRRATLAFIQAAACFLLAVLTPKSSLSVLQKRRGANRLDSETAVKACSRIQLLVQGVFIAWSVYYLITGVFLLSLTEGNPGLIDRAAELTFNMLPSVFLFWLYLELAEFTIDKPNPGKASDSTNSVAAPQSINVAFHRIISSGVFLIIIFPVWYIAIRNNTDTGKASSIIDFFDVASSCLNGVALALVVGRLGSKIIDPGSLTIGLLYFYAVIQPAAASFHANPTAHLFATTVALPLKVLLWLVFVWAFTTGVLSEYVQEIRVLLIRERSSRRVSRTKKLPLK